MAFNFCELNRSAFQFVSDGFVIMYCLALCKFVFSFNYNSFVVI